MTHHRLAAFGEKGLNSPPLPLENASFRTSGFSKYQSVDLIPDAKRWDHHLSLESKARSNGKLKLAGTDSNISAMISLGAGRPASQYFPWKAAIFHAVGASHWSKENATDSATAMFCKNGDSTYDLATALNYGHAGGSPQVVRFFTEHVQLIHSPPYKDWETCLTCGSTSALDITFRMLCDRGDWILTEKHTYSGAIGAAKPLGLNMLGVEMDKEWLRPDDLTSKLLSWDAVEGPKPRVLYTIPSGHNPTGTTQTTERRKAIYQIAEQHDILIIEDDPYYFLQLGNDLCRPYANGHPSEASDRYLNLLPTSYLALDTSGRVLRLDSASKILAPGLRCGWLTGCSQLVRKFLNHTEASTLSPSGPSQVMIHRLLSETWGHDGFIEWLGHLSLQYKERRDVLIKACKRHLPEICRWDVPTAGMFLWIQLDCSMHPTFRSDQCHEQEELSFLDIEERIYVKAQENGVLVSKGSWFQSAVQPDQSSDLCFRMTFADASMDSFNQAAERFGDSVRDEFSLGHR